MLGRPLQDRGVLSSEGVQTRKAAGILGPEQDREPAQSHGSGALSTFWNEPFK